MLRAYRQRGAVTMKIAILRGWGLMKGFVGVLHDNETSR
jgi:hypothetical protein